MAKCSMAFDVVMLLSSVCDISQNQCLPNVFICLTKVYIIINILFILELDSLE